ncbi:MAG: hypothetical protein O7G32_02295, partial [SAR324 cluster bacterium]|nr:hypothetical protein [SAR324 cluster bacterium]
DVMDQYADLVKHVESNFYLSVARYSTSAFMRLKLGKALEERQLSPHIYESTDEAIRYEKLDS